MNPRLTVRTFCHAALFTMMSAAVAHATQEGGAVQTVDLQKRHHAYYQSNATPEIVSVEGGRFISILGSGSPGTDVFYDKKKALRLLMQELVEMCTHRGSPFLIPPLEISYWYPNLPTPVTIGGFYTTYPLNDLRYRMMMRLPDFVTNNDIEQAGQSLAAADKEARCHAEVFEMDGGIVLQVLHTGPFADELETLKRMQIFADARKVNKSGPHHEIHLTDWEKGQPQDSLKTILRDPIESISAPSTAQSSER